MSHFIVSVRQRYIRNIFPTLNPSSLGSYELLVYIRHELQYPLITVIVTIPTNPGYAAVKTNRGYRAAILLGQLEFLLCSMIFITVPKLQSFCL